MAEFFLDYGLFFAKAVTVVAAIAAVMVLFIAAANAHPRGAPGALLPAGTVRE